MIGRPGDVRIPDGGSMTPYPSPDDVRMRGFLARTTVAAAWEWLDARTGPLGAESIPIRAAAGRSLAAPIQSDRDVPTFDRSMMDGIALRATDTLGASPYNRLRLQLIGESLPGRPATSAVGPGQALKIMTGAPIPVGADAVLPAERIEWGDDCAWVLDEVPPGKNVGCRGEDIVQGAELLPLARRLRPQDLGVLASIGRQHVAVTRQPRVRLIITGNELVAPGEPIPPGRIADANGPMLEALVCRDGGIPLNPGIVPDQADAILQALQSDADLVVVSGGSSVGQEDLAPRLVAEHGELAIHGIAMRPSSPTGMGILGGRVVCLLPGNPVSCLCGYDFFAGRAIRALGGRSRDWPYRSVSLPLRRKLVSTVGRVDYARVKVVDDEVEPLAIAGASILTSTTRADGFVVIPADCEGYPAGTAVTVWLYDAPAT